MARPRPLRTAKTPVVIAPQCPFKPPGDAQSPMISRYTARVAPPRNPTWTTPSLVTLGGRFCIFGQEDERQEFRASHVGLAAFELLGRESDLAALRIAAQGGPGALDVGRLREG